MLAHIKRILTPPHYDDEEYARLARIVHIFNLAVVFATLIIGLLDASRGNFNTLAIFGVVNILLLGVYWLNRNGNFRLAGFILLFIVLLAVTFVMLTANGINDISITSLPVLLIMAALLLDQRGLIGYTALVILAVGFVTYTEINVFMGLEIAPAKETFFSDFFIVAAILSVATLATRILIDNLVNSLERARVSEARLRGIIDNSPDFILEVDREGQITSINRYMKRYLGKSVRELVLPNYAHIIDETIERAYSSGENMYLEVETYAPDGSITWDSVRIGPIKQRGEVVSLSIVMIDITEHKRYEETLIHNAFHDLLTNLPNRALFLDRLGHLMAHDNRKKTFTFAVLFLDMDRFKDINDSLGHSAGDSFLIEVAHRLESCIREVDTIARLGGDEFVILLEDIESIHDVTETCSRIQKQISLPYIINGNEIVVSGSIGVVFSNKNYTEPEEYLRDADIAMYRAKEHGRSRYEIFDDSMRAAVIERLELEAALRRAIIHQEFILFYQPIMEINKDKIIGFEALVRWKLPDGKIGPPAQFIPIAEETGMIHVIGEWVLKEACTQLYHWSLESDPKACPLMSVNVSGVQLMAPRFLQIVENVIHESGIDPRCLILEITESALIKDQNAAAEKLNALKKLGIKLYLDDFGTGYSSLSFLSQFPIDALKIDRQFVENINYDDQANLVSVIATLAKELNLLVVAEGIETEEQLAFIKDVDCQFGQGYFYSKPVDVFAASQFLEI